MALLGSYVGSGGVTVGGAATCTPHGAIVGSGGLRIAGTSREYLFSVATAPVNRRVVAPLETASPGSPLAWPFKDPGEELDYDLDWATRLGAADTIAANSVATWTVSPSGLTISAAEIVGTFARIWLTGGASGQTYALECSVFTTCGRRFRQSVTIAVGVR